MTTPTNDRQTSERERTHGENCYLWDRHHYECALREIERLRAENEALRTVTDEDVIRTSARTGVMPVDVRKALESFIRSKESRRG